MEKKILVNGGYPLHTFEDLENLYTNYITKKSDRTLIESAFAFMMEKHKGQMRKSGEPYYHHLIEVAYIVTELQSGPVTICAALLHDVVEDTNATIDEIQKKFGEDISLLVDSLTKIQRLKLSHITSEEFEAEDHRKIFIGMAKDIRVIIIKLADRLHNMRTLASLSEERQQAIAQETLDVFVPIAHRLGLDRIKSELEDLSLSYLKPEQFEYVKKLLSKKAKTMEKSLNNLKKRIADLLFEKNIPFEISSRVKSIYSIYTKMFIKSHAFEEIYDILALRIITESEMQCYEILGLIHKFYKPVPGRFKDYIAMPKPNMYQSLHTTIVSGDGNIYEIQIRTKEMDEVAEGGVAAHWAYKENNNYSAKQEQQEIENKLHWFRDFVSLSGNSDESASEYIDNLTRDIFEANVYVFTPKGKVIELPTGSTPIDFAYRIHTRVGDTASGAYVNGVMVPLNTVLKTGDMVEIKTNKNATPNEDWLLFVKSSGAKSAIRKYLAKKNAEMLRDDKIVKGKQSCIDAFKDRGIDENEMLEYLNNEKLLAEYHCKDVDDLFVAVSGRKPVPGAIIEFLKIKKPINVVNDYKIKTRHSDENPVYARGVGRIAISLSNCCRPIPGDEIVGYVTKGKGITVHRTTCPNVVNQKNRLVEVFWHDNLELSTYPVDLNIEASDRPNLLVDIMNKLTSMKVTVSSIHARSNETTYNVLITTTIYVSDAKRLNDIINSIFGITGVYNVTRIIH
mgnify:CR=1 FL=1